MFFYVFFVDFSEWSTRIQNWLNNKSFYWSEEIVGNRVAVYISQFTYQSLDWENLPLFIRRWVKDLYKIEIDSGDLKDLESRYEVGKTFLVEEKPGDLVREEVLVFLYAHPHKKAVYCGRGSMYDYDDEGDLRSFEIYKGERQYWFRIEDRYVFTPDLSQNLQKVENWFKDSDARVVLSLGSGGFRLFSLLPFLHFLEERGLSESIDEIWGCSGGSIVGYLLAHHVPVDVFKTMAYRIYQNSYQNPDELPFPSNLRGWLKTLLYVPKNWRMPFQGIINFSGFTADLLEQARSQAVNLPPRKLFTLSYNLDQKKPFVLTNQEDIPDCLKGWLMSLAHSPEQMVVASSAIPLLFKPAEIRNQKGLVERWSDGVLFEETPLSSIIRKWYLERKHVPGTPKKLKIFYLDLGVGPLELLHSWEGAFKWGQRVLFHTHEIWKRQRTVLEFALEYVDDIEIQGIEMKLGYLGLLSPQRIPSMIHRGYQFFEKSFRRGFLSVDEKQ